MAVAFIASIVIAAITTLPTGTVEHVSTAITMKTEQILGLTPPSPVSPRDTGYGIAAGSSLLQLSDSDLAARMSDMQELGATWVRFDFDWSIIQPDSRDQYSWDKYDKVVKSANDHGLTVLGIIDYTPAWARSNGCDSSQCPPSDPNAFAQFASAVASRYKSQAVHDWEVWNEPNNPQYWRSGANPEQYAELLKATYTVLHAADPNARVLTGGLSPQSDSATSYSPISFLTRLYADGAKGYFDAVSDHPYTFPLSPSSREDHAWNQMARDSNSLRSVMVSNGDEDKKIWITEFGSPTGGPGAVATPALDNLDQHPYVVSEEQQAIILSSALQLYKTYSWAGPFMYYSYKDAGTSNSTNENFFGLVDTVGRKKPAYQVYYDAIH